MAITSKQRRELLKFIAQLEPIRGRHTELVSVYVPAGYDLNKIINHLAQEQGTASNIKDATTRKNVTDSLERMIQHLRLYKGTPVNGLAAFAGNISEREGQQNIEVFSIETPEPLNFRLYRCDKIFVLDALKEMAEKKDIYGLIVMDKREGNIALLKGKTIIPLTKTTSYVPGKTRAGGQCLLPDTLIQSVSGDILEVEKAHNPNVIKSSMIKDFSIKNTPVTDKWDTEKDCVYKIITKNPRIVIECSKDHIFFVRQDEIKEKAAEELKKNDLLIMAERINIKGTEVHFNPFKYHNSYKISHNGKLYLKNKRQEKKLYQKQIAKDIGVTQTAISVIELGKRDIKARFLKRLCSRLDIDFDEFINKYTESKHRINLPLELTGEIAQIAGYFLGDGSYENERINFSEQCEDVARYYESILKKVFNANTCLRFRKEKGYWQLRVNGKPLVRFFKHEFPEIRKATSSSVPEKVLISDNNIVASFIKGFFDAEGYANIDRGIALGIHNKKLVQQLQMLFLRFGIIASTNEYDNRRNPYSNHTRFTLNITEKESLKLFQEVIGFSSKEKSEKLKMVLSKKSNTSYVRQIAVSGKKIRKIIEKAGYNLELFPKVNNFFRDERMMSKQTYYNSILKIVKNKDIKLYNNLKKYYDAPVLAVRIADIKVENKKTKMVDISTGEGNFIANGLIVHNSSARFERIREGAAKEFFSKLGEYVKENFLENKELKGIIVGGPGMTKNEFVDGNYITDQVKRKIIAIKDLSYTGDFGLQELVDKSQDVLANEEISKEKDIMQKFFGKLSINPKEVAYGEQQVRKALGLGAVDVLLLSEEVDDKIIEELEETAEQFGSRVELISVETREGAQLRDMGKFAAILRYEVH
ncbi:helix-turn-helix domain-containing protein [Candidatus Woesearchaeota archaeon]|nr:helix-turn-helix domain-containing protein [Candidatus Woesearchaeota archaeon]